MITDIKHECGEFSAISQFWAKCEVNHIDDLFPSFNAGMILSARRKQEKDIDFQYRKEVLFYCCRIATLEQKERLIHYIEKDLTNKQLLDDEYNEVNAFLAALGEEESITKIINSYLGKKPVPNRYGYSHYSLGVLRESFTLLKKYMELYDYSMEKSNERRHILWNIAKDGIKQHISKKSFPFFKRRILKKIKTYQKSDSWAAENYREFLLHIEQDCL